VAWNCVCLRIEITYKRVISRRILETALRGVSELTLSNILVCIKMVSPRRMRWKGM
jgi:hypothetical protein